MKAKKIIMTLLIIIAVVSIGVAVSYPIRYKMELDSNNSELEDLSSMRRRVMEEQHIGTQGATQGQPPEEMPVARDVPIDGTQPDGQTAAEVPAAPTPEQAAETSGASGQPQSAQTQTGTADSMPAESPGGTAESTMIQNGTADSMPAESPGGTDESTMAQTGTADSMPAEAPGGTDESTMAQTSTADSMSAEAPDRSTETGEMSGPAVVQDGEMTGPAVVQDGEMTGPAVVQDSEMTGPAVVQDGEMTGPTVVQDGEMTGPTVVQTDETETQSPGPVAGPTRTPGIMDLIIDDVIIRTPTPAASSTPVPVTASPSPTPDRKQRDDADTYKSKDKVELDESKILPELKDIYALNHDLVGWLYIEDTNIDYPVVQLKTDRTYYLSHDFYGNTNSNGQIIMEDKCDPYTPSYNLVLSGHHMNSGAMFGRLGLYKDKAYWETHKIVEFDTLMARKRYVIFGAFYSADYDVNEKGFRYSADIQYNMDADMWLGEIEANRIYDTGIETEFGDEFITLTTCDHSRRSNGRFVVVARRIREGEIIQ